MDPYKEKEARAAEENAKIKEERKRKMAERNPDAPRRRSTMSADYLEALDDDGDRYATTSIKNLKKHSVAARVREDDSDMDGFIVHDSSEEGDGDWEEGNEMPKKRRKDNDGSDMVCCM